MSSYNFSQSDKQILRTIVDASIERSFITDCMVNSIMKDRAIILYPGRDELQLVVEKGDNTDVFINDLLNFVSIIEYLKSHNLVFIHQNIDLKPNRSEVLCIQGINGLQEKLNSNEDQFQYTRINTVYQYVVDYFNSCIYARQELKEYVSQDFKNSEQLHFEKTILWTRITAVISLLGLIIALLK